MTERIVVDYEALENLARQFHQRGDEMRRMLERVQQHTDSFHWIGDNADYFFREANDEFLPALNRLYQALHTTEASIHQVIQTYQQAEESGSAAMKGADAAIKAGLGATALPLPGIVKGLDEGKLSLLEKAGLFLGEKGSKVALDGLLDVVQLGSKASKAIGGGILGGAFDYIEGAMKGEHAWDDMGELSKESLSGAMKGGIALIPKVGWAIVVGDTVVQAAFPHLESAIDQFGKASGINTDGAEQVLRDFRENVSLDRATDAVAGFIVDNAPRAVEFVVDLFGF